MKVVKKLLVSMVAVVLLVSGASTVSAATESEISPMANIVQVGKPIVEQGSVSNYKLGQLIEQRERGVAWLNAVAYALSIPSAGGTPAASLALAFADEGLNDLEIAYAQGKNLYWVEVYASGVEPSLSKQAYVYFSKTPIRFVD